jgi:hypothetical protein
MTNPSLDEVRSAKDILQKEYDSPMFAERYTMIKEALGIAINLAQSYLEVSGELPEEYNKETKMFPLKAEFCDYEQGWNEALSLCRLAYLKQAKRVECCCGEIETLGVVHRKDKPCYIPNELQSQVKVGVSVFEGKYLCSSQDLLDIWEHKKMPHEMELIQDKGGVG